MDRNTVFGLLLIFAIFIGFTVYNQPSKEELERQQQLRDSLELVQRRKDSIQRLREQAIQEQADEAPAQQAAEELPREHDRTKADLDSKLGLFSNSGTGSDDTFILENEVFKLWISKKGGKIYNAQLKDYQTYDSLPLELYNNDDTKFGYSFFSQNRIINTNDLYFQPYWTSGKWQDKDSMYVSGTDSLRFAMRLYTNGADAGFNAGQYIEYVYTLYGNKYMMDYDLNLVGMNQVVDAGTNYLDLAWEADMRRQERSLDNERNETTIYYKYHEDEVDYLSESKDDEESLVTAVRWLSFKTRFFVSTIIADQAFSNADIAVSTNQEITHEHYLKTMKALIGVPFENSPRETFGMKFYFGPNKYSTLNKFDMDLEKQIPLGWSFFLMAWINIYAVIPVFDWLGGYGWNYGIVILILTIMLKIVLFPIAYKTYKSSAKMRVLKPEVDELSKKYPKPEDAMKKQQATMNLYKKAGVNPMAGCVPMLLQFPILIALFRFFPSSIELRQESFLWAHDLSSYDSILNLPFTIPFYGDHVSLFTLLMTISTIFYTKINNDMMGSTSTQMPGMKTMMYIMPVMFLGIFNNFASGLSYYYLLANLITFAQMFIIRRTIDEKKILKQIQLNKKKPVKKSKFQQRLEDMAKQRGYDPKTGKPRGKR
ncbi:MAG: membrane protein insertase YidC [Bacteroidales bacterium]